MKTEALSTALINKIENILNNHNYEKTNLVSILLTVQDLVPQHYISEPIAYYIAEKLQVKITTVYDCITFYAALYDRPRAHYPLQVCNSAVCRINDSNSLMGMLQKTLNVGVNEATEDGKFMIEQVTCFGACDQAPAVRVNGKIYGHLNSEADIRAMLDDLM